MSDFTHFNDQGRAKMVDVGEKPRWHGCLDAAHHSGAGRNMNQIGG